MTDKIKLSKAQIKTVNEAWDAIAYLSCTTAWADNGALKTALKLERKQGLDLPEARANCVKAWLKGASKPDTPASKIFHMREGYLTAYLLGVRHAVDRSASDYHGPMFQEAVKKAEAASAAYAQAIETYVSEIA